MAFTDELLYSTSQVLNTTLGPTITLDGSVMTPSQVDDAIRYLMAYRASAITRAVTKSSSPQTAVKADYNQLWRFTVTATLNLTAAATLTDGWCLWVRNDGAATDTVTIDPNGAETIDGGATLVIYPGQIICIICNGTTFYTLMGGLAPSADAGAAAAPIFPLIRNSPSAAPADVIGQIPFIGRNSAGALFTYAAIQGIINQATNGSEYGALEFRVAKNFVGVKVSVETDTSKIFAPIVSSDFLLGNSNFPWGGATINGLIDISGAAGSQIKFGNANNSANTATFDGYLDSVAYTPTFTGFGTVTGISVWSYRLGDRLYVYGKFTGGTPTAVEGRMTLGFNGTNANVNSDATKIPSIMLAGYGTYNAVTGVAPTILMESNVGYATFGFQGAAAGQAGLTKQLGNAFLGAGAIFSFFFSTAISTW